MGESEYSSVSLPLGTMTSTSTNDMSQEKPPILVVTTCNSLGALTKSNMIYKSASCVLGVSRIGVVHLATAPSPLVAPHGDVGMPQTVAIGHKPTPRLETSAMMSL